MEVGMRSLRLTVLAGLGLLLATAPASATLTLVSGTGDSGNSTTITTNNYGYSASGVASSGEVAVLFVFNSDGTIATYVDSTVKPYDNIAQHGNGDDTQIGVVNNSGATLSSFMLSGSSNIFYFGDGDGIDTFGATKVTNNPDTTGYGGPIAYFSGINGAQTSGTVNFYGGLATGTGLTAGGANTTYFSLEGPPSALSGVSATMATPEPNTVILAGIGAVMAVVYRQRRRRNSR
jgi:hypothetical protein